MYRSYTLEEKASALDLLHEKGGDVPYVSYLTGISERTLYTWRKQLKYAQMEGEVETPQPIHWLRQQPEREERLQQQQEKRLQQQQQRGTMTAFGMTQEQLEEALKVEFIPSPYTNLHADLLLHLQHLNFSLTDDPEMAHRKALAFSRIFDVVQQIEEMVKLEKPQLSLIKYEYPDKTYHDIPYWSNAVYARADDAYNAVLAEAKRQYEEQQSANPAPEETSQDSSPEPVQSYTSDMEELHQSRNRSVEEILAMPFTPEDFIPKHTGFHKILFGEDPYAQFRQPNEDSDTDSDSPPDT